MYCLMLVLNFSFLPSVSGEKPTLPELVRINLPSRVGPKYHSFGTLLLRDDFGDRITNIVEDFHGKTERRERGTTNKSDNQLSTLNYFPLNTGKHMEKL